MTVEVEFQRDSRKAAAALATDPAILFDETLLVVPVRFTIDGHDMLPIGRSSTTVWLVDPSGNAAPSDPTELDVWTHQPVLGFLAQLRHAIDAAQRSGRSHVYLAGQPDLIFTARDGSRLEVTSPNGKTAQDAPVEEFTDAIARFEGAVRAWLKEQAPQLMSHPSWANWFTTAEP